MKLVSFIVSLVCVSGVGGTEIQVIGAGFGRTGTASMMLALERLGYKTYHMVKVLAGTPRHPRAWGDVADGVPGAVQVTLDLLAEEGYNATLDYPSCALYKEQMERYPNAKVILTLRKSGFEWARSFVDTIAKNTRPFAKAPFTALLPGLGQAHRWMFERCGIALDPETLMPTLETAATAYDTWAADVMAHVPADRLLVFSVGDGWEPLCSFLDVADCPGESFPRAVNDKLAMIRLNTFLDFTTRFWHVIWPSVGVFVALLFLCCCCRTPRRKDKVN